MGLFSRIYLAILLLLFAQTSSCVSTTDFLPLNPCDPLYEGDQICPAHLHDSGLDQNREAGDSSTSPDSPDSGTRDTGDPDPMPCLDDRGNILPGWCLIEDTCHQAGNEDPKGRCRYCEPDLSTHTWTNLKDGSLCTVTTRDSGSENQTELEGRCEDGQCLASGCECHQVGICCDGCHPKNPGEECFHNELECTRHVCTDQGRCEQEVLEGWCLTDRNQCYHTMDNPNHCGECNHTCQAGQVCVQGQCVLQCWGRLVPCGEVCVDLLTDKDHCGQCDRGCPTGEVCMEGECTLDCAPRLTLCEDVCADLNRDPAHCGQCFSPCEPGAVCEQGRCIIKIEEVSLSPPRLTLNTGEASQLTAHIHPEDATDQNLIWSTADRTVAVVNGEGVVTGMSKGQTVITVTTRQGGLTGTAEVRVGRAVTGVTLDQTYLSLSIGETSTLNPEVAPSDADDPSVIWSSDNSQVVEVDQGGRLLARSFGEALITVTTADGGWTDQCQVVVTAVQVTGVTVSPGEITLERGDSAPITATVTPGHATVRTIIWSSTDEQVAQVANNRIIAIGAGETTLTATTVDGKHQAHCQVTVVVPVTGIELTPDPLWVPPGTVEQVNVTVLPRDATNQEVLCHTKDQGVATIASTTGLVTGLVAGTTQITCTTAEGGFDSTTTVRVGIRVTGLELSHSNLTLDVEGSFTLLATTLPPDATDQTITWHSSAPAVARVLQDGPGEVEAVSPGKATITATTTEGGFQARCEIVVGILVDGVTLTPPELTLSTGRILKLTAHITPPDATNQQVTWSSSHPALVKVDQGGVITTLAAGRATIQVTTVEGGKTAQVPVLVVPRNTYAWSTSFGDRANDDAKVVAVDQDDNVYLAGYFSSPTITVGGETHYNQGSFDIFLAKFNPEGEPLWSKKFGGTSDDLCTALALDQEGNLYLTGYFASFDLTIGEQLLQNRGGQDVFLAKFNGDGEVLWVKSFGGLQSDSPASIAVNPEGDVILAGDFNSTHLHIEGTNLVRKGYHDIFLCKFTSSGERVWSHSFGLNVSDQARSVVVDSRGDIYLTGNYTSSGISFDGPYLTSRGSSDAYLAKFNSSGEHLWSQGFGGSGFDQGITLAMDPDDNVYLGGNSASFDIRIGNETLPTNGSMNFFLAKFNPDGERLWAQVHGGNFRETITSIAVDPQGELHVTGLFSSINFAFPGNPLPPAGDDDIFLARFSLDGTHLWSAGYGGIHLDRSNSLAIGPTGSVCMAGSFRSNQLTFGDATINHQIGNGTDDGFLVKFW